MANMVEEMAVPLATIAVSHNEDCHSAPDDLAILDEFEVLLEEAERIIKFRTPKSGLRRIPNRSERSTK